MVTTTSPSNLDLTKPVQTRDGRKARILCSDAVGGSYPVIALITTRDCETPVTYTRSGKRYVGTENDSDLVNAPVTVRVAFYENMHGHIVSSIITQMSTDEEAMAWGRRHICIKDIVLDT